MQKYKGCPLKQYYLSHSFPGCGPVVSVNIATRTHMPGLGLGEKAPGYLIYAIK